MESEFLISIPGKGLSLEEIAFSYLGLMFKSSKQK